MNLNFASVLAIKGFNLAFSTNGAIVLIARTCTHQSDMHQSGMHQSGMHQSDMHQSGSNLVQHT